MSLLNPLNPAAGDVPVPEDPREITAALHAGIVTQRLFPYLEWRYGERGTAFARSDSAWLVWLSRHIQQRVHEQIAWLRDVLSNRGMPSWILQTHLRVLHRRLTRTVPEKKQNYLRLHNAVQRLRKVSEANISDSVNDCRGASQLRLRIIHPRD